MREGRIWSILAGSECDFKINEKVDFGIEGKSELEFGQNIMQDDRKCMKILRDTIE